MDEDGSLMTSEKDVETLHSRIDKLAEKFEVCNSEVVKKLTGIHTDVEIIKKTCSTRELTCAKRVNELDIMMRGNGKKGVLTRVETLETKSASKEKFAFLIIGATVTGCISLLIAMIIHFFKG